MSRTFGRRRLIGVAAMIIVGLALAGCSGEEVPGLQPHETPSGVMTPSEEPSVSEAKRHAERRKQKNRREERAQHRARELRTTRVTLRKLTRGATPDEGIKIVIQQACGRQWKPSSDKKERVPLILPVHNPSWRAYEVRYDKYWPDLATIAWPHALSQTLKKVCPDQLAYGWDLEFHTGG